MLRNKVFLVDILIIIVDFQYENHVKETFFQKFFNLSIPFNKMKDLKIVLNRCDMNLCNNKIRTNKYTIFNFLPLNFIISNTSFSFLSNSFAKF